MFAARVSPGGPTAAPDAPPASDNAPATPNTVKAFVRPFRVEFLRFEFRLPCDMVEASNSPPSYFANYTATTARSAHINRGARSRKIDARKFSPWPFWKPVPSFDLHKLTTVRLHCTVVKTARVNALMLPCESPSSELQLGNIVALLAPTSRPLNVGLVPSELCQTFLIKRVGEPEMARTKQASKRNRRSKAVPVLGAAGLSLSLASGASASTGGSAADVTPQNATPNHEIFLGDEEISDVSLSTFYVFDKENTAQPQVGEKVAAWGCGCRGCRCGGCRCGFRSCWGCGGCGGCWGCCASWGFCRWC